MFPEDLAPMGAGALRSAAEERTMAGHILYVPGKHELYDTDFDHARSQLVEEYAKHGITLPNPDTIVIDGLHFIGAPLWTAFLLDGIALEPREHCPVLGLSEFDSWIQHEQPVT